MRLLLVMIVAAGCAQREARIAPASTADAELQKVRAELASEEQRSELERNYIEDVTATINAVHAKLEAISPIESSIRATQRDVEGGAEVTPTQREQIFQSIDAIRQQLEADARALSDYRNRSAPFEGKIAALEETIVRLQSAVETKSREISALQQSLDQMTQQVAVLKEERVRDQRELERKNAELRQRDQDLAALTAQLHEVQYLVGDVQDLVRRGILIQTRRFLRRAETTLAPNADRRHFVPADARSLREIALSAPPPRVKLFPPRPAGSCRILPRTGTSSVLVIDDTEAFWRVPFVVIALDQRKR